MRLGRALQEKMMDVRLRDKLLAEGKISKAEVDAFLSKLPEDQSNAMLAEVEEKSKKEESEEASPL